MKIIKVLFKDNEIEKLIILKTLIRKEDYSMNELCEVLGFKRTTLRRYLNELNEDLEEYKVSIIYNHKHRVVLEHEEDVNLAKVIFSLQYDYMTQSIYYNVLMYIIFHYSTTIDAMAMDLSFSKSYCYHVVQKLNEIFEVNDLGICIQTTEEEGYIKFQGLGSHIRLFLFQFLLNFHQTVHWPFQQPREYLFQNYPKECRDLLKEKSYSTRMRVDYLHATSLLRLQDKLELDRPPQSVNAVLDILTKHSPLAKQLAETLPLSHASKEEKEDEIKYYITVTRMFIPNLEDPDTKIAIAKEVMANKDDPFIQYCKLFFSEYMKTFQVEVTEEERLIMFFFIVNFLQTGTVFQSDFVQLMSFVSKKVPDSDEREKYVEDFYRNFLKEHPSDILDNHLDSYVEYGSRTLYLLYVTFTRVKVKAFIEYNSVFNGTLLLREKIAQSLHMDYVELTNNVEEAEIIITDFLDQKNKNATYFVVNDIFSEKTWKSIYKFITDYMLQKMLRTIEK